MDSPPDISSPSSAGCRFEDHGGRRLNRRRGERGQAMVEMAIILPVLCLLLFSAVELGTVYMHWQQLSSATSEGARKAVVSRTQPNPEDVVEAAVRAAAPNLDNGLVVSVSPASPWTPGSTVTVTAEYPYSLRLFGFPLQEGMLSNSRAMRVEQ